MFAKARSGNRVFATRQTAFKGSWLRLCSKQLGADVELVMYENIGFWHPMDTYREWEPLNKLWDVG